MRSILRRHEHGGKSSRGLLDPENILKDAGLHKGDTFLDAGSGDGYFSVAASSVVGESGKVYAVDIFREAIERLEHEIAQKHIHNITTFVSDIADGVPIEDKSVDMALMADVLHGFVTSKEVDDSLREIARTIKEKGKLLVVDFKKMQPPPGPPMSIRMTQEEVESVIGSYGFKMERAREVSPYHYGVVFVFKGK